MSISEFSLQVDGLKIAGKRSGSDQQPPLILLHGSGASSSVFEHQFDSVLSSHYHLIAIDLPGHGASSNATDPDKTYGVRGMAGVVSGVIDQLELCRATIYGCSMGGHIAMELACQRSDLAGIALGGAPPVGPGTIAALRGFQTRLELLLASKEHFSERDAQRFMRLSFGNNGTPQILAEISRADGRARVHFVRSLMRGEGADQRRFVATSDIPVAMIDGADDPVVRRSYIEQLDYASLWREKCHVIPHAAHAPFWEQPLTFNRLLRQFLRDLAIHPQVRSHGVAAAKVG